MVTIDPNRYYTEADAARKLGVQPRDVQQLINYRELAGQYRFDRLFVRGGVIGAYLRRCNPHDPGFIYYPPLDTRPRRARIAFGGLKADHIAARERAFNERMNLAKGRQP